MFSQYVIEMSGERLFWTVVLAAFTGNTIYGFFQAIGHIIDNHMLNHSEETK